VINICYSYCRSRQREPVGRLALLKGGDMSVQRALGAVLGLDRTTTAALLRHLEDAGLVSRRRDPANRRAYKLTLTAEGEKRRAAAADVLHACNSETRAGQPSSGSVILLSSSTVCVAATTRRYPATRPPGKSRHSAGSPASRLRVRCALTGERTRRYCRRAMGWLRVSP